MAVSQKYDVYNEKRLFLDIPEGHKAWPSGISVVGLRPIPWNYSHEVTLPIPVRKHKAPL
jgi:hypothetical protein